MLETEEGISRQGFVNDWKGFGHATVVSDDPAERLLIDQRAIMAARNNADWYAMMFDIHGLRYTRSDIAFLAIDAPPPYHGWMTTLDPGAYKRLLALVAERLHIPGFGLKDSYHCLDLADQGLAELFSAEWIYAESIHSADATQWARIETPRDLLRWELAWKDGGSPSDERQFPDAILDRGDVAIWGRFNEDGFDGGVIANASDECVGMSNWFGRDAIPAAATVCAEFAAGKPLVGYGRADELDVACQVGFEAIGALRVWCMPA